MNHTRAMIGKIKIGQEQLGLDDATYRAMLLEFTGHDSSTKCNQVELGRVIDHMANRGAVFTRKGKSGKEYKTGAAGRRSDFYPIPDGPNARQKRHIAAIWRDLGYDMLKLDTRVQKQFGVERFLWLQDPAALQTLGKDIAKRLARKQRKGQAEARTATA